jgi:hypothetical protein
MTLREWWYGKRAQVAEALRPKVSPMRRKVPPLHKHQTAADLLDWLCMRHKASYRILRYGDGVLVLLDMPDQSVVASGLCATTALAVAALHKKLGTV